MNNLKKMLEEKGLHLLDLASPSYLPGRLIKIHYFWAPGDLEQKRDSTKTEVWRPTSLR
jgi:hypothetical protein